ncbi:MAG: hypothetical protein COW84_03115 [Gammaproteobacteria bacterium CG22_combo_CG10-13_8_21_14_all_40_8]|nr:MAG: hypothetical protein COW84_03115 [Gammaproteobacteria bacterium CG22_combo_CG10-13_8_21_14_all_40_8]
MRMLIMAFNMALLLSACQPDKQEVNNKLTKQTQFVEANGELASTKTAVIGPPSVHNMWKYKVTFMAAEGTTVSAGDPIINFDTSQLLQNLSFKKSELNTAKKTLENLQLTNTALVEKQKLHWAELLMKQDKASRKWEKSKGLESSQDTKKLSIQYQLSENESKRLERTLNKTNESNSIKLSIAKNDVERLQSEVDLIQLGIQRMTMLAPKAGVVIYKPDYEGKKVSAGDTVWMGRQILELPSLDQMMVKAKILEADAGKVVLGQSVDVVLDAAPEKIFKGKISKLGQTFRRESALQPNVIFDADVMLEYTDADLMRPGMAARLTIHLLKNPSINLTTETKDNKKNSILLPIDKTVARQKVIQREEK